MLWRHEWNVLQKLYIIGTVIFWHVSGSLGNSDIWVKSDNINISITFSFLIKCLIKIKFWDFIYKTELLYSFLIDYYFKNHF